ncbi:hypothetical protein GCM10020219_047870 [Nonomuraea dietziae]
MWDDLVRGAIGAVVLVDTSGWPTASPPSTTSRRRSCRSWSALNGWDGHQLHTEEEVRDALTLSAHVPIVRLDARSRDSVKSALITLVEHALTVRMAVPGLQ